jgi:hypothetical protein
MIIVENDKMQQFKRAIRLEKKEGKDLFENLKDTLVESDTDISFKRPLFTFYLYLYE